jgi:hypothetical protein
MRTNGLRHSQSPLNNARVDHISNYEPMPSMAKKFCSPNTNKATDEFDDAPSHPEKRCINFSYAAAVVIPFNHLEYMESISDNIDLISEEPSLLTGFMNASKRLELEMSIRSIEMDRYSLNTAQSTISGEMKQVIQATLSQSKEINAMQSEMGDIYSMVKELRNHMMPNSLPLPPRPNYAAIGTINKTKNNASPTNMISPVFTSPLRKKQNTGADDNLQLPHVKVLGLNESGSKSGQRVSANAATPGG